jgi:ABC-type glutathione transport system ATPase component
VLKKIIELIDVKKNFGQVLALKEISFDVINGETLGIVGESGSGKTTLARIILGLTGFNAGKVLLNGQSIKSLSRTEISRFAQIVFQDPYSSLNPRMRVGEIVAEPLLIHKILSKQQIRSEVERLFELVHLPKNLINRFAHELSGGERQRVGIARSLALKPSVLIADEPISSLDLPLQVQMLELFKELKQSLGLTLIFISHDLEAVGFLADRIVVMEKGQVVEVGEKIKLIVSPLQEYTRKLLAANLAA